MGTQQCDLSENTTQIGSECLDNEQRVLGTVVTDSVIDEKTVQIGSEWLDNEQRVLGTVVTNSVIDEKTVQIGSECLGNKQRVLDTVATDSVIDEKSNQVLVNMTESSVIQLPEPSEQVPVCLSHDKSENKCVQDVQNKPEETSDAVTSLVKEQTQPVPAQVKPNSANKPSDPLTGDGGKDISLPNEPGEMSDAVTSLVVEGQTQPVPAQVNSDSANKQWDPPSGDGVKDSSLPNEPGETSDAVTSLDEEQTQPVPAQVNSDSANKPSDPPSGDGVKDSSLPNEPGETSDAVTSLDEEQTQPVHAQVNSDSANKPSDPPSGDGVKDSSLPNEPGETSDAVASLVVEEQTQPDPAQVNSDSANKPSDPPSGDGVKDSSLPNEPGETSDAVTSLVEEQTQPVPAQVNSDSANKPSDPPSGDGVKDSSLPNEPGETSDAVTSLVVEEQTQPDPAQVNSDSANKPSDPPSGDGVKDSSLPNEPGETSDAVTSLVEEQTQPVPAQVNSDSANKPSDPPSGDGVKDSSLPNEPGETSDAVTSLVVEGQTQPVPAQVNSDSANKPSDPPSGDGVKDISLPNAPVETSGAVTGPVEDQTQSVLAQVNADSLNEVPDPPSGDVAKNVSSDCSERKSKSSARSRSRHVGKSNSKPPKKYILRSLGSSDRALRSRDNKPKAPEPINNVVDVNNDETKTKKEKKKKKKARKEGINDQFSRIRAQLRYYLNRMGYEQNLIDAYSGEGWKGGSLEKLKPEKEIQRAKSEILRRKLKIRDLFQNLDSLCAEGKLPESLFDSEGEIDSEDIFCAKCQTKVLGTNNDIILCDGACDRGYHQLCLDPPLLTEDIPPGDEGWLCPGCDCKDDCIDIVNDLLGTSLSLTDTWERVFPEAATAAGSILDNNLGLPSDDSDDDDYNPNGPEDVEVEGGESSSDESEYASASEKLEETGHEDQYMGLPSEDSEDDDYDPDAPNLGGKAAEESSNSDFTSDSEDLAATIKDNMSVEQDGDVTSASLGNVKNKGSNKQNRKKPSLADELSSLVEPDLGEEDLTPASGKRNVERLDYQKLYEETYHSETSDDEDWTATDTPSRKKKLTGKITPVSPNGSASNNSKRSAKRNTCHHKVKNTNNSPTKTLEGCTESGSRGKKCGSPYKKLGEAAVQRLYKSFKENQYPERATKESLAQEIGLTFHQVDKWFGNSRWSFRHSPHMKASPGSNASQQATDSGAEKKKETGNASQQITDNGAENKEEKECELVSHETIGEKSRTPSSKKRKQQATGSGAEKKREKGDNGAKNKGEKAHVLVSQETIGEKSRTPSSKKRKQQTTDSGGGKKGESSKKRKQQATDSGAGKKGETSNASQQVTDNGAEKKGEKESGLISQKTIGEKSRTPRYKKRKQLSEPQADEAGLAPNDPTPPKVETGKKTKKKKGK